MTTLLIATRNAHKVGEIRAVLGPEFRCLTLADLPGAPVVVEDAQTFAGNAARKAGELARWVSGPHPAGEFPLVDFVLADDSGLAVDALGGAPGVHSARFAALDSGLPGNSPDTANNEKLMRLLADVPLERRTARFHCAIALTPVIRDHVENASPVCYVDEFSLQTQIFEACCEGRIQAVPTGGAGFGYDPLFVPDGFSLSFAELGEETKNRISHRARALGAVQVWLSACA